MPLDPARTVAELRELQELTGDENGAQRVAWTDTWERARDWLRGKVAGTGADRGDRRGGQPVVHARAATSERALLIGGHIDSVPNGGWLDGCLNVMAGVEVLRRIAEEGTPPVTVRLVNWADEEGARFGRSLFGSSAAAGSMADQDELRTKHDADGIVASRRALRARRRPRPRARRAHAARERRRLPRAAHRAGPGARVDGPPARRRPRDVRRRAEPDHVPRPGRARRLDADGPAPRRARRRREARAGDPRDREAHRRRRACARWAASSRSRASSRPSSRRRSASSTSATSTRPRSRRCSTRRGARPSGFAQEENIDVEWERIWNIEPILFDDALIELADESIREVADTSHRLPSGPLHDAAEVSRAGIPTVMMFVQSLRGLSHTKLEDTKPEHLELSVQALDRLATKTLARLAAVPD